MIAVNYSNARQNLAKYCDAAVDNCEPVVITRKNDRNIVLMSQDDYDNLMENLAIRSNAHDYNRLLESIAHAESGKGLIVKTTKELVAYENE
jgi:antitoxin YefM